MTTPATATTIVLAGRTDPLGEYSFEAVSWVSDDAGYLTLAGPGGEIAARFAPGSWHGVWLAAAQSPG